MGADFSRIRSNPLLDFAGLELKQGGVVLDADFNEMVAIVDRRLRAAASDIVGPSSVSATTPNAFKIIPPSAAGSLSIGKGRLYVDGLLVENHSGVPTNPPDNFHDRLFDSLMAEPTSVDPVTYETQPYLPNLLISDGTRTLPRLPTILGHYLVYLDVWEREVTHLEKPELIEAAVGVETSSRLQTVWQVRVLTPALADATTCSSSDADVAGWSKFIAPSGGRLTTGIFDMPPESDPCELPPTGGYRGLENQTYRVEIQDPGELDGTATFKWSRENASVGSRVASMISATELELQTLGRDDVLRVNTGDWVEITDDVRELSQQCGEMRKITVNEAARRITFTQPLPPAMIPGLFPDPAFPQVRNLRVRRWDQKGKVLQVGKDGTTSLFRDLDVTATGAIPVPTAGTTLLLENGVTVQFDAVGTGDLKAGDYWVFAARTADASVEILSKAPPRGIHHHYARLGIWDIAANTVTDCRTPWPPRGGEGHDCGCTACVTVESHAAAGADAFTIQMAVKAVIQKGPGGTICLGPGVYNIDSMVAIRGSKSAAIKIVGHGLPILRATLDFPDPAIMLIENSARVSVEGLSFVGGTFTPDPNAPSATVAGLLIRDSFFVRVHRCAFSNDGLPEEVRPQEGFNGRNLRPAIAIAGAVGDTDIQWNVFDNVDVGIGDGPESGQQVDSLARVSIESNLMICNQAGVLLTRVGRVISEIRFSGNSVRGPIGFQMFGLGLDVTVEKNTFKLSLVDASIDPPPNPMIGVSCTISQTRISNNHIVGGTGTGKSIGIRLDDLMYGVQITGNRIDGLTGSGIFVAENAKLTKTIIAQNQLRNLKGGGIVMPLGIAPAVFFVTDIDIVGNSIENVALADDTDNPKNLFMAGIQITNSNNVNVIENVVENVGTNPDVKGACVGIVGLQVSGVRLSGNRVVDIGPAASKASSAGVVLLGLSFDIVDNEVRRSTSAASNEDSSPWQALLIGGSDVRVRGNLLQSFGNSETVDISTVDSCIFSENRCICDNRPGAFPDTSVVSLKGAGAAVIASSNYITGPEEDDNRFSRAVLLIDTTSTERSPGLYSALGNIVTGSILANKHNLSLAPQLPVKDETLNVAPPTP